MSFSFAHTSVVTKADCQNAEQMAIGSRIDDTFHIMRDMVRGGVNDSMISKMEEDGDPTPMVTAYFLRMCGEIRQGTHKPLKLRSFASVVTCFERWITERVPEIEKGAIRNGADLACVPFISQIPKPVKAEVLEAEVNKFVCRWNNGGDLAAKVKGLVQLPVWGFATVVTFDVTVRRPTVMVTLMMKRARSNT